MSQFTADQFAYQSLRDLGCLRPAQKTSSDFLDDIFTALNNLVDTWLLDRFMCFTIRIDAYNLTGGRQIYTIGPSEVAPNFTATRPTRIEEANIILNTVNPVVRLPLSPINDQEWASIRVQQIPFAIPTRMYYDGGFDQTAQFATIYLWPGPLSNYQLELFTWQQLTSFASRSTVYKFPPGYARCIQKNLAVEIAPMAAIYGKLERLAVPKAPLLALVQQQAREAKQQVESYNAPQPVITTDPGFMGGGHPGGWSYAIGDYPRH